MIRASRYLPERLPSRLQSMPAFGYHALLSSCVLPLGAEALLPTQGHGFRRTSAADPPTTQSCRTQARSRRSLQVSPQVLLRLPRASTSRPRSLAPPWSVGCRHNEEASADPGSTSAQNPRARSPCTSCSFAPEISVDLLSLNVLPSRKRCDVGCRAFKHPAQVYGPSLEAKSILMPQMP